MTGERSLAEEWEGRSEAWERWARTPGHDLHFERFNWPAFCELLPGAGRATLDIGCGEGRAGLAMRARGHVLTGVDSAPMLAELAAQTGAYERVLVADAAALPLADDSFDLVVAFMSLQDMDDPAGTLREAARVLAPGGRLAAAIVHPITILDPGPEGMQRGYFEVQRTVDDIERGGVSFAFHQLHRPLEGWFELLLEAGFTIEAVREPRPAAGDADAYPALARARERPLFLHLRARLA